MIAYFLNEQTESLMAIIINSFFKHWLFMCFAELYNLFCQFSSVGHK